MKNVKAFGLLIALYLCGTAAYGAGTYYATPEEAVQSLIAAVRADDEKGLLRILGTEAKPLVDSGDDVADKMAGANFVRSYEEAHTLEKNAEGELVLSVGKDAWPFPIPLVKEKAGWRFDTAQGKEEILNRRVGRNELSVMQALLAYVDAQREYYLLNPSDGKVLAYAQKFMSDKGKRDGLYYPTKEGEAYSPIGPLFEAATMSGRKQGEPYYGYNYRILKAQGPKAAGGAYSYVAQGYMLGGHALIAWPATYGNSGVMTFMVNHDGVVYEKDLGPQTATTVQKINKFDPGEGWRKAEAAQ